ncbi:MAG: GNAT family N-acetyltransferase [Candidatus Brocadiae bacterium]|nr:GNAT family N-acetyltransferase [Candidatus Brocadiia bacterium]
MLSALRTALWSRTVHHFLEARIETMPVPAAGGLRPAEPADEDAVAAAFPHVPFRPRLATGDRCWLGWVDGRLAHQTWTSTSRAFIPQVEYWAALAPDELYIYDCITLPEYRGRGLYPAALRFASRAHLAEGRRRAGLGILSGNTPSLHGASRAGFRPAFTHTCTRRLGLVFQNRTPAPPPP